MLKMKDTHPIWERWVHVRINEEEFPLIPTYVFTTMIPKLQNLEQQNLPLHEEIHERIESKTLTPILS